MVNILSLNWSGFVKCTSSPLNCSLRLIIWTSARDFGMCHASVDIGKFSDQIFYLYTCWIHQHWRLLKAFLHVGSSQISLEIHLQKVKNHSRLITIFTVYFVYLSFIPIIWNREETRLLSKFSQLVKFTKLTLPKSIIFFNITFNTVISSLTGSPTASSYAYSSLSAAQSVWKSKNHVKNLHSYCKLTLFVNTC